MPPNPHPESISAPMWDILYTAEQRVRYVVPPKVTEDDAAAADQFDGYDDPNFHRSSHEAPFEDLCESLKLKYAGTGKLNEKGVGTSIQLL